jgi:hypothetical protein
MVNDVFAPGDCRGTNSWILLKSGLMWFYKWPIQLLSLIVTSEYDKSGVNCLQMLPHISSSKLNPSTGTASRIANIWNNITTPPSYPTFHYGVELEE